MVWDRRLRRRDDRGSTTSATPPSTVQRAARRSIEPDARNFAATVFSTPQPGKILFLRLDHKPSSGSRGGSEDNNDKTQQLLEEG